MPKNWQSCLLVAAWATTQMRSWGDFGFGRKSAKMEVLTEPPVTSPITKLPVWKALEAHYGKVRKLHLRQLFADDRTRGERMTAEAVGIFLDYSKNRITAETLK